MKQTHFEILWYNSTDLVACGILHVLHCRVLDFIPHYNPHPPSPLHYWVWAYKIKLKINENVIEYLGEFMWSDRPPFVMLFSCFFLFFSLFFNPNLDILAKVCFLPEKERERNKKMKKAKDRNVRKWVWTVEEEEGKRKEILTDRCQVVNGVASLNDNAEPREWLLPNSRKWELEFRWRRRTIMNRYASWLIPRNNGEAGSNQKLT